MPLLHVQVNVAADTTAPRDRIVNTFYLNIEGDPLPNDYDAIAEDACELFALEWYGNTREITTKVYLVGPPPQYPVGEFTRNTGLAAASTGPREVAVVLSYYGERNLPRTRGRMYLSLFSSAQVTANALRPSLATRTAALDIATGIAALGGLDVDW